jgi:hypothetical protein
MCYNINMNRKFVICSCCPVLLLTVLVSSQIIPAYCRICDDIKSPHTSEDSVPYRTMYISGLTTGTASISGGTIAGVWEMSGN